MGVLTLCLVKLYIIDFLNYNSIKAVDRCMINSINVNKMWKLNGGCIYSVEVEWWLHVQCGSSMVAVRTVWKLNGG
jgi:hypothetical protein